MLYIAVCGEESYGEALKEFLSDYLGEKEIPYQLDTFCSGEKLLDAGIAMMKYKVILLDISMKEANGMTVAGRVRERNRDTFLVLIAASGDHKYARDGYKVGAIRFLLRTEDPKDFQSALEECMDSILEKMTPAVTDKEFRFTEGRRNISLQRLHHIESDKHKLTFYVMEENIRTYTMYETLRKLENELEGYDFIRIHQSYLVNLRYIRSICRYRAVLDDKREIAIPKARYRKVKDAFAAYQKRHENVRFLL